MASASELYFHFAIISMLTLQYTYYPYRHTRMCLQECAKSMMRFLAKASRPQCNHLRMGHIFWTKYLSYSRSSKRLSGFFPVGAIIKKGPPGYLSHVEVLKLSADYIDSSTFTFESRSYPTDSHMSISLIPHSSNTFIPLIRPLLSSWPNPFHSN